MAPSNPKRKGQSDAEQSSEMPKNNKKKQLTKAQGCLQLQPLTSPSPQWKKDVKLMAINDETATPPSSPYNVHQEDADGHAPLSTEGSEPGDVQGNESYDDSIADDPDDLDDDQRALCGL